MGGSLTLLIGRHWALCGDLLGWGPGGYNGGGRGVLLGGGGSTMGGCSYIESYWDTWDTTGTQRGEQEVQARTPLCKTISHLLDPDTQRISEQMHKLFRCFKLKMFLNLICRIFLAVHNSSKGDLVTHSLTHWGYFYFWHTKSGPRDLWPLRHLIRVMRRHDLTEKFELFGTFLEFF